MAPLTPQKPRVRTTAQISWLMRCRVVDRAYPTRHMNRTFCTVLHFTQTASLGAKASSDVIVIHTENSKVNTTSGVIGSCSFSVREITQEMQVNIAIT